MNEAETVIRVARLRARFLAMGGHLWRPGLARALGQYIARHGRSVELEHAKQWKKRAREAAKSQLPKGKGWQGWGNTYSGTEKPTKQHHVEWMSVADEKPKPTVTPKRGVKPEGEVLGQIGRKAHPAKLPKLERKYAWQ